MIAFVKCPAGRLVLIGLGMLLWQQSGVREVAAQQFRRACVWFTPGTEGQLQQYEDDLERTLELLLTAEKRLQTQSEQQVQSELQRRDELARLDQLLSCFRAASINGGKQGFPQSVFARSYTEQQITDMVQKMLNQRGELERQEATSADSSSSLSEALSAIAQRISETRCHLQNMPIYRSLSAAGDAAEHSTEIQQALLQCVQHSRETLAIPQDSAEPATACCAQTQTVVLSAMPAAGVTDLLAPSAAAEISLGGIQASDFLTPTPQELVDGNPCTEITVSELQHALRELVRRTRTAPVDDVN